MHSRTQRPGAIPFLLFIFIGLVLAGLSGPLQADSGGGGTSPPPDSSGVGLSMPDEMGDTIYVAGEESMEYQAVWQAIVAGFSYLL